MKFKTIKEATEHWVKGFNVIPQDFIIKEHGEYWFDEIKFLATESECNYCGSTDISTNEDNILVCETCGSDEIYESTSLPMWVTIWAFGNRLDEDWARNNIDVMRDCGFWVYESDDLGLFFVINGAGYDFYEEHWIPLYKARGLMWHEEANEAV